MGSLDLHFSAFNKEYFSCILKYLIQPPWRTLWRFLKKLGIKLQYDPAIPLVGIYPEKTIIQMYTCSPMFIAALCTTARTWKQPKYPWTWMDKEVVVHIHSGILFSHKEEQSWIISRDASGPRFCRTEWSKSETQNQMSYINIYMWHLERWYR